MDYADNIIFELFVEDFHEFLEDNVEDEDLEFVDLWMEKREDYRPSNKMDLESVIEAVEEMLSNPEIINENIIHLTNFVNANKTEIPARYYPLKCKQLQRSK